MWLITIIWTEKIGIISLLTYEIDTGEIEIVNEAIDETYNFFLSSQFFGSSVENVIDFSLSLVGIFFDTL